jgi:hypothetical protein
MHFRRPSTTQKTKEQSPKDDAPGSPSQVTSQQGIFIRRIVYVDTLFNSFCVASTSPGDGSKIPADQIRRSSEVDRNDPNLNVVEVPGDSKKPSFKEKVFGECTVMRI